MSSTSSFRVRPAAAGDAAEIVSLIAAYSDALNVADMFTKSDLVDSWQHIAPEDRVAIIDGERIVAYGTAQVDGTRGDTDGYVHPAHVGRGAGALLIAELEARLTHRDVDRVTNATLDADVRAQELLQAQGYRPIRRFWRMRIAHTEAPQAPAWPDGARALPFDPAEAEEFHAAFEEAFVDHWEHDALPFPEWRALQLGRDDFDAGLWRVVRVGDEIVAGTICRPERFGVGWISILFTRRAWRRQGLGSALLRDAFARFWERGQPAVGLAVDAGSETGAQRVYEQAGMQVEFAAVVFEKPIVVDQPAAR